MKRRVAKQRKRMLPRHLHAAAIRLTELREAHMAAICDEDESFYHDGRHEELVSLLPIVHSTLGIRPWEDGDAIVREALAARRSEDEGPA